MHWYKYQLTAIVECVQSTGREPMKLLGRSSFVGSRRQPLAPNGGSVPRLMVHDLKQ